MKLETEAGRTKRNPTPEEISKALSSIDGKKCNFAILGIDDMTYVQTSGAPNLGYSLEYQTGSVDEHYMASDQELRIEDVEKAFLAYSNGNMSWIDDHEWTKLDLLPRKRRMYVFITIAALIFGYLIIDKTLG